MQAIVDTGAASSPMISSSHDVRSDSETAVHCIGTCPSAVTWQIPVCGKAMSVAPWRVGAVWRHRHSLSPRWCSLTVVDDRGVRTAVARVIGPAGDPVGAAFLVTPDLLLSAAHVVSLASGNVADGTEQPDGMVSLNFVVAPDRFVRAEVVHWSPPGNATPEDIAGLRLIDPVPDGAAPAPLTDLSVPVGRQVMTLGFPRDAPFGGWGHGQLADADARSLVQVDTVPDSQFTIEAGFSGTPVWDLADRAVAGLIVEGWTRGRRSGFMIPTSVLLSAWPELAGQVWPASPFRGLRSFAETDHVVFFGRDELIEQIVTLGGNAPALTMVGPSGVGKSSLLHAGVLPRLRGRNGLVVATIRPSQAQTPLRAVALALATAGQPDRDPLARGAWVDEFADRLARGQVAEVVGAVLDRRGAERLLLVVDQFEEILIAPLDEQTQVAAVLTYCLMAGSRLTLLTALRADFLGRALQHRDLAALMEAPRLVTIGELTQSGLRAAIVEPVRDTRLVRYEAGLVERLLTDVGVAPGRLPLLQFTLAMLWEDQESGELTHRAYDALGGIDSALAGHAEAVWSGLGTAERSAAGRLLVQLLYPLTDSTSFVRRAAPRTQLDDAQWSAAQRLAADRARLVVVRQQDGDDMAELTHDALVTHWQRLAELGEQDREFREWQEGLRQRIRRNCAPLVGADLREALRWQASRGADLAPPEKSYADRSRRNRFRRRRMLAVGAAVILAVGVLVVTQAQSSVSDHAADTMLHGLSDTDRYARLRTTLRAYRTSGNEGARGDVAVEYAQFARLDKVLPDYTALPVPGNAAKPQPVEFPEAAAQKVSADGRTLVTTDPTNDIVIWRVNGDTVTNHPLGQSAERVTISRDGRYVAYLQLDLPRPFVDRGPLSSCGSGVVNYCVDLYETTTGRTRKLAVVPSGLGEIPVIRFDPTSQVLAVVYDSTSTALQATQQITTWDVSSGRQRDSTTVTGGDVEGVQDMWLAPGGNRAVLDATVASRPGSPVFYDHLVSVNLTGPSEPFAHLTDPRFAEYFPAQEVAVSGDGDRLAAVVPITNIDDPNAQASLVVWDVATGRTVRELPHLSSARLNGGIALDLHGDRVAITDASATGTGMVWVWRLNSPTTPPVTFHAYQWQDVLPVGGGPDGPLVLVDADVLGLVLPAGGKLVPMQRLAGQPPYVPGKTSTEDQHPAQWSTEMTAMLASSVPGPDEVTDLPAGAYTGPLGG